MFNLIPFAAAILVSMHLYGEFLMIHTTDKAHGRSQRFLINVPSLARWLNADDGKTFCDRDLNNFIELYRFNEHRVTMRFTWLTSHGSHGSLHGYQQTMLIPVDELKKALIGFRVRVLVEPDVIPQCRLSFSESAMEQIGKIICDKKEKRALCRCLRDSFHWRDTDEIYIVADWKHDFYFTTPGMNGGIVQHEKTVRGKDGKTYSAVVYQIHT